MIHRIAGLALLFPAAVLAQPTPRYAVVMDEIFPDPSPRIALPGSEFIELKNVSDNTVDLFHWKISDGTRTATIRDSFALEPDSFVILCPTAAAPAYSAFGRAIGVSNFPSLNNDADRLSLLSPDSRLIHAVGYSVSWYGNDIKKNGGWTLEMIDTRNPCAGQGNWTASIDPHGGTPGKINSVDGKNTDEEPPALLRTYTLDSLTIVAVFDEPLDSASAASPAAYRLNRQIGTPLDARPVPPLCQEVILSLPHPMQRKTVYTLTADNLRDCSGNGINSLRTASAGLPEPADSADVVLNELLFNPPPGGYDYIELYNRSAKVIDLQHLYVSNRDAGGGLSHIQSASDHAELFFPGEFRVLTENSASLQQHYVVPYPDRILERPSLPSLPDDQGTLVLTNERGQVTDEIAYSEKWHFPLIQNDEGVALERIDYNQPTQNKDNWTSAASTAGYGTPTYGNSQVRAAEQVRGRITVTPEIFSPDNDGFEDYASIRYQMTEPGYMANIRIFNANGQEVRALAENALLARTGYFRWDGLDDRLHSLPVGIYIILTETFNLRGQTRKFKNIVTLARRF